MACRSSRKNLASYVQSEREGQVSGTALFVVEDVDQNTI